MEDWKNTNFFSQEKNGGVSNSNNKTDSLFLETFHYKQMSLKWKRRDGRDYRSRWKEEKIKAIMVSSSGFKLWDSEV